MQGKVDKARDIVLRLHRTPGDPDQEFARGEFYQMQKQTERDREMNASWVRLNGREIMNNRLTAIV